MVCVQVMCCGRIPEKQLPFLDFRTGVSVSQGLSGLKFSISRLPKRQYWGSWGRHYCSGIFNCKADWIKVTASHRYISVSFSSGLCLLFNEERWGDLFLLKPGGMSQIQPALRDWDSIETTPLLAVHEQMAWGAEQRKGWREDLQLARAFTEGPARHHSNFLRWWECGWRGRLWTLSSRRQRRGAAGDRILKIC